jgi:hypothetical protein
MVISTNVVTAFDKKQHLFMMKSTYKTRNKGELPQHKKDCDETPTANILLSGEKLKTLCLRLGKR